MSIESIASAAEEWRQENIEDMSPAANAKDHVRQAKSRPSIWEKPRPIPAGLRPVDAFQLEFLPESVRAWVADISDRMQCPPDFVGAAAVVSLGSLLGRRVAIRPQRKTDWYEVANTWGMGVGRPGMMKSPAMSEAMKPLSRLESNKRKLFDEDSKAYDLAAAAHKIMMADANSRATKAAQKGGDIAAILSAVEAPEQPKALRHIVNDTSYEALGEILVENPNGVLAFRDELVSLLKTLDREEFAAARGFFLTAWNGTSGYTFDRIIRGRKHIEAACISLLGSTQPGKIAEYISRATSGGAGDDGLIQRFGILVWPDQSPAWIEVDRFPDSEARENAWAAFERFDGLSPEDIGAETDQYADIPYLRFDDAAQDAFGEWRKDLESRLRSNELSPSLESHLAKYRKLVPALALINHLADVGSGPIEEASLVRALAFAEYLESHARRAYAAGTEAETTAAKAILKRIRDGALTDGFTLRDICQNDWSRLTDRIQVDAGLKLLVELNWLAPKSVPTGGRPRDTFVINPRGFE